MLAFSSKERQHHAQENVEEIKEQQEGVIVAGNQDRASPPLLPVPLLQPVVSHGGGGCKDDFSCSLGGSCTNGVCECEHWTTGTHCNLLNMQHLTREIPTYGLQMPKYHSWGGHAVEDEKGVWNGFFSFMCNHLSLSSWTTASSIVHATAKEVDGPYTVQRMAVQPWAHNAYLTQDLPSKEWLLYHIGTGVANASKWSPCVEPNYTTAASASSTPVALPGGDGDGGTGLRARSGGATAGDLAISTSSSLDGPWTPLSNDPHSINGGVSINFTAPWSQFIAGNPAPFIFENGTILLYYSAQPCPQGWGGTGTCISVARADSWKGPYTTLGALPMTFPESEDPSVFRTAKGFHMLTNVNNGHYRCDPSVPCGGHAWSKDGLTWSNLTIGAFGPNLNLANGSVWRNAYVERPQVVQGTDGTPIALFLGMSKLDGYSDSVSWSSKFCAPGQNLSQCGPTTSCTKGAKGCGCSAVPNPPGSCQQCAGSKC